METLPLVASDVLADWLARACISLAFTTYQTNRLFCVGTTQAGELSLCVQQFDRPMGLCAAQGESNRFCLSTRYQLWQFDNMLRPGERYRGCDRLYAPKRSHTTGNLSIHDIALSDTDDLLFINTQFSCVAKLSEDYSFEPIWQPPFISQLVAEDRCHLNGLALHSGQPAFVTACGTADTAAGWRNNRAAGGVVIDVRTNEVVASGLSMPHSPRWHQGRLWLLNAGTGELGYVQLDSGDFVACTAFPGFARGLSFWENYAIVGISKPRDQLFQGLPLGARLKDNNVSPWCGIAVVDLLSGEVVHTLQMDSSISELFEVVVLPTVRQPHLLGFQSGDIERLVTFPDSAGVMTTKPAVSRTTLLNEKESNAQKPSAIDLSTLKFQYVYHLTPENLIDYDGFTFPSLSQRWQRYPQRGELLGLSAMVQGEMVGFAVTECLPDSAAEIISLFVAPTYRHQGIGAKLIAYTEKALRKRGCDRVAIAYSPTAIADLALLPLLKKLSWQIDSASLTAGLQTARKKLQHT